MHSTSTGVREYVDDWMDRHCLLRIRHHKANTLCIWKWMDTPACAHHAHHQNDTSLHTSPPPQITKHIHFPTGLSQPKQDELKAQWERSRNAEGNGPVLVVAKAGGGGGHRRPLVVKVTRKEGAFARACACRRKRWMQGRMWMDEMRCFTHVRLTYLQLHIYAYKCNSGASHAGGRGGGGPVHCRGARPDPAALGLSGGKQRY